MDELGKEIRCTSAPHRETVDDSQDREEDKSWILKQFLRCVMHARTKSINHGADCC